MSASAPHLLVVLNDDQGPKAHVDAVVPEARHARPKQRRLEGYVGVAVAGRAQRRRCAHSRCGMRAPLGSSTRQTVCM